MTQASTGKPLGYYGVNTSVPAIQSLQEIYGLDLERLETEDKGAIMIILSEILQQENKLGITLPRRIELSSTMDQLYQQGGREQVLALLRCVFERL